ncbi:hypothetical protein [Streptomyces marokkonensis]|uniref:hypothetical protein n=1 Tax=Streptomyces marokkonensis TaxID=324855 RepID=UPI0011F0D49F|nr:hypothetical protein [Streptomyces marokkonensis]
MPAVPPARPQYLTTTYAQDGTSTVPLAGDDVRLNPCYVRTSCGGATADGRPVVDQSQHALSERTFTRLPRMRSSRYLLRRTLPAANRSTFTSSV